MEHAEGHQATTCLWTGPCTSTSRSGGDAPLPITLFSSSPCKLFSFVATPPPPAVAGVYFLTAYDTHVNTHRSKPQAARHGRDWLLILSPHTPCRPSMAHLSQEGDSVCGASGPHGGSWSALQISGMRVRRFSSI